jgi:hypothetical protein
MTSQSWPSTTQNCAFPTIACVTSRDVEYLVVDDQPTRTYSLSHAANVLQISDRTLRRQLQERTFVCARFWPPRTGPNHTVKWLICADDLDAVAAPTTDQVDAAATQATVERLQREVDELRQRNDRLELEVAVRDSGRVAELEQTIAGLRRDVEQHKAALAGVLDAMRTLGNLPAPALAPA